MLNIDWKVKRQSLKELIAQRDGRILVGIGVANGAEARQLHHSIYELYDQDAVPDFIGGFVTFVSGYLCAAAHGLPDMGYILRGEIVHQTDIIEQATWLAALDTGKPAFPIGVDIDTGYGNEPASILLTCRQVHKQGAQYVQIEDQYAINKSCGHMEGPTGAGKLLISAEEMIETRLKPAVSYAESQDDLMVMARTDAIASLGIDEAVRRANLYVEAGARLIFIEAPEDDEQLARAAAEFKHSPVLSLANMIEGSPKTPYKSPLELHDMGFGMALYCIGPLLAGRATQRRYFSIVGRGESVMAGTDLRPERWFEGFHEVIGRQQTEHWNRFFRGEQI
ncbi:MAG: isocitrate lyase/PEP mutase family protein [Dehalococcoidales bacterium]|nr:isocitrate lyase/PEP mutase family protein [Dehalococcoidales bacterium]